jgi:hypothetical protein
LNPQTNPGIFPGDNALTPKALINLHARSGKSSSPIMTNEGESLDCTTRFALPPLTKGAHFDE